VVGDRKRNDGLDGHDSEPRKQKEKDLSTTESRRSKVNMGDKRRARRGERRVRRWIRGRGMN